MDSIYLDHAATTPLDPRVRDAMLEWLGPNFGNASSRHPLGVRAARAIDEARGKLARALAVQPRQVLFTSGATESNNLAISGRARAAKRNGTRILIGPTEHPSIWEPALALRSEGFSVESMRLDARGSLDLEHAASLMTQDTVLVAQMLVSNEFGTIYPVRELSKLLRARSPRARLHVDAVQAFGKLDCAPSELGCDSLALSAHKLHGPQGTGALIHLDDAIAPLALGGGQEHGLRPGTENVAAIVGFGVATAIAEVERGGSLRALKRAREAFLARLQPIRELRVLDPGRSAGGAVDSILALSIGNAPAEVLMHHLEAHGVCVSAGAACQSRKNSLSPSFAALGLGPDEARRVLRISFARTTTVAEAERAGDTLVLVHRSLGAVLS